MKKELALSFLLFTVLSCSDDSPTRRGEHETLFAQSAGQSEFHASELDRIKLHKVSKDTVTWEGCDSVEVANFKDGHKCCVTGKIKALPGDIYRYRYQTSKDPDPFVSWEVTGDIEIIDDQNTIYLTVKFGPNFTFGKIVGRGDAKVFPADGSPHILECDTRILIENPNAIENN
jgi:hypothetical protein